MQHVGSLIFGITALGFCLGLFSNAKACPNPCEISQSTGLAPELPCLTVEATVDTCSCGVDVRLENKCEAELLALGFVFPFCLEMDNPSAVRQENCQTLLPGHRSRLTLKSYQSQGLGEHEVRFMFEAEKVSHTLTVGYNVESFAPGCQCHHLSYTESLLFLALSLLLFGFRRCLLPSKQP